MWSAGVSPAHSFSQTAGETPAVRTGGRTLLRRFFARIHSVARPALVDRLDGFFRPRHLPGSHPRRSRRIRDDHSYFQPQACRDRSWRFSRIGEKPKMWSRMLSSDEARFSRSRYEARKTRHLGVTWLVVWGARTVSPLALSVTQRELWSGSLGLSAAYKACSASLANQRGDLPCSPEVRCGRQVQLNSQVAGRLASATPDQPVRCGCLA